jgi:hypothetical protein
MTSSYLLPASLLAAFLAGWTASNWHTDSLDLVAEKAAQNATGAASAHELNQAVILQDTLSRLSANETTIIRENVKLVDRPIYNNVCLDLDGLRNANAAKNGTGTGEPLEGMPQP